MPSTTLACRSLHPSEVLLFLRLQICLLICCCISFSWLLSYFPGWPGISPLRRQALQLQCPPRYWDFPNVCSDPRLCSDLQPIYSTVSPASPGGYNLDTSQFKASKAQTLASPTAHSPPAPGPVTKVITLLTAYSPFPSAGKFSVSFSYLATSPPPLATHLDEHTAADGVISIPQRHLPCPHPSPPQVVMCSYLYHRPALSSGRP